MELDWKEFPNTTYQKFLDPYCAPCLVNALISRGTCRRYTRFA